MKFLKLFFAGMTFLGLMGCNHMPNKDESNIRVYTQSNTLIHTINDASALASLNNALANKKRTYVKLLPRYQYYIEWGTGDKQEQWLVTASGYIADKAKPSELYKTELPDSFLSIIKQ